MSDPLEELRREIAAVDREMLELIARRVELARRVGRAKHAAKAATLDPQREATVVREAAVRAREAGLPDDEIRQIFWQLIGLCRRAQEEGDGRG